MIKRLTWRIVATASAIALHAVAQRVYEQMTGFLLEDRLRGVIPVPDVPAWITYATLAIIAGVWVSFFVRLFVEPGSPKGVET